MARGGPHHAHGRTEVTSGQAWRWVAHHWTWGALRLAVIYLDLGAGMVSTTVNTARGLGRTRVRFSAAPR